MRRPFQAIKYYLGFASSSKPALIPYRERDYAKAAIIFLHGFSGDTSGTWGRFPELLLAEPELRSWDVFALGYPSSLRLDVLAFWDVDPDLATASLSLRTALDVMPLARYESVAIIAHSMGGLIAQHAVLDPHIHKRIGHLFLFGCPSDGLNPTAIGALLKRQARDMSRGSVFIRSLRAQWEQQFGTSPSFVLRAIAGNSDGFVSSASSLEPFPDDARRVVHGNHSAIVKPSASTDASVQVVLDGICRTTKRPSVIDSALVAVELRHFTKAVDLLLPRASQIDYPALVQLALALDGLGRGTDALNILEQRADQSPSDALGALGGRVKRRWLSERVEADWTRARALYWKGLCLADPSVDPSNAPGSAVVCDPDQAMYHAINVAFLDLLITPASTHIPAKVKVMATRALEYSHAARDDHWREATRADAHLMLGDLTAACIAYESAVQRTKSPREIDSMYSQAIPLAAHLFGEQGIRAVEKAFGASRNSAPGGDLDGRS